jgi:hypothetical protein
MLNARERKLKLKPTRVRILITPRENNGCMPQPPNRNSV